MVASDAPPSLAKVESILAEMGLSLTKDIGERIARFVPAWFEEKNIIVPLRYINYDDYGISISLNGEGVKIPSRLLPFDSSKVLNKIKSLLERNLEAFIDKKFSFQWNSVSNKLTVEHEYVLRKKIKIDDASLRTLKKVEELRIRLGPFSADSFIGDIFEPSEPKRIVSRSAIPTKFLHAPKYNTKCLDVLMSMAETCYVTGRDFWFKVGDVLIWEEPRYSKATYIFKWPEEPLRIFIFRIWISELQDIRRDPESGYIDKAIHVPLTNPDVSDWENNLEIKIQDEETAFTLGKFTI
jgi:hypothetical protein